MHKISIVVPFHFMDNWQFFLTRCLESIWNQSFNDYEIVLMKIGSMPVTSNRVIEGSKGEIVKILYLDDYLAHNNALQEIVDNFKPEDHWLVTGCLHQRIGETPHSPHFPEYTEDMHKGLNKIGSPSVLSFRKEGCLFFDENLSWVLDADLYKRYYDTYGSPKIINDLNVVIGIGEHQMTNILTDEQKKSEHYYLMEKYE